MQRFLRCPGIPHQPRVPSHDCTGSSPATLNGHLHALPLPFHTLAQLCHLWHALFAIERFCLQSLGIGELDAPTAEVLSLTKTYPVDTRSNWMHPDFTSIRKANITRKATYSAFHCLLITTLQQLSPSSSNTSYNNIYIYESDQIFIYSKLGFKGIIARNISWTERFSSLTRTT